MTALARKSTPIAPEAVAFLARNGREDAKLTPFVGDASPRRYFRLDGAGALLMEDRTDPVGFAAYLRVSAHLNALGLSAPRVIASDMANALALVEDFGDDTYANCLAKGHDETDLYRLAVDALLHLHHDPAGGEIDQPLYDMEALLTELAVFADWFAPAVAPGVDVRAFGAAWRDLWSAALAPITGRFDTLVLRDFHVDNLMFLDDRDGIARCGLLDFQDAVIGACEYDLLSLLQDARRDLADGLEEELLSRYMASAPARLGGGADILQRYALLGAQRHARILGVFVRLFQRDGKPRYLSCIPRVLGQFITAMDDANISDIKSLLDVELSGWRVGAATLKTRLQSQRSAS